MDPSLNFTQILRAYPEREDEIMRDSTRIKKLSTECGCSLGAWFMLAAFGFLSVHTVFFYTPQFPGIVLDLAVGLLIVFAAGILGKATGIGLAKWRLAALIKKLHANYPILGD